LPRHFNPLKSLRSYFSHIFLNFVIPSHTPFQAHQRFTLLSSALYSQCITWNTKTWLPLCTPFKKLVPFFTMSVTLVMWTSLMFYNLAKLILWNRRSTDVCVTVGILLVLYCCMNTVSITMILTNIYKTDEICVLYINSEILRNKVDTGSVLLLHPDPDDGNGDQLGGRVGGRAALHFPNNGIFKRELEGISEAVEIGSVKKKSDLDEGG
ncbi:hypothetical protein Fcan01_19816, partial [Folsomia candida]